MALAQLKPASCAYPVEMLSRIEDKQHIHMISSSESARVRPNAFQRTISALSRRKPSARACTLQYYLPRFKLHFDLRHGSSKLHSYDYADYFVADAESLQRALACVGPELQKLTPLALPLLLHHFLLLVSDNPILPIKVLIPDAFKSSSSVVHSAFSCASSQDAIEHHVYSFHPYTGNLDTSETLSRLHLAALHAASSCAVPLPGLGMTGEEHALQLLRQSWVNRPLTASESHKLQTLTVSAAETPALKLMCERLHAYSTSLAFLYDAPLTETHDAWLESNMTDKGSVMQAYGQNMHRNARFPVVNHRGLLTREEAAEVMSEHVRWRPRHGQSLVCIPAKVRWSTLQRLGTCKQCEELWGVKFVDETGIESQKVQVFVSVVSAHILHPSAQQKITDLTQQFERELQTLDGSQHQKQLAKHCINSLRAYNESSAHPHMHPGSLHTVQQALTQVHQDVKLELDSLARFLLEAIAFAPECDVFGTPLRAYQASGLATTLALADLLRATTQENFLNVCLAAYTCECMQGELYGICLQSE